MLKTHYHQLLFIYRQDQLVIQMIRLMDKILRADKLDLRLTPYHVLATSVEDGFVQFIESVPLRDVISTWGNIQVAPLLISSLTIL